MVCVVERGEGFEGDFGCFLGLGGFLCLARCLCSTWFARQIRQAMISRANIILYRPIPFIRTLTVISPLLGLLGTVIGMIEVFDVVAGAGTGNPRAVASGVSRAMITTMAGMVVALAGLFFGTWVRQYVKIETERLSNGLRED